jgi:hypothetical protein
MGDPTPLGWTITIAYGATAFCCWRAARHGPHTPRRGSHASGRAAQPAAQTTAQTPIARLWTALAAVLVLLGLNKQLDLQTMLTAVVRDAAKQQGWYADRRPVQIAAVVGSLVLVVVVGALVARAVRGELRRLWPAVSGVAVLGAYAAMRTTSLHELDAFMVGGPLPMKWWGELLGLALIAFASAAWRSAAVSPPTASSTTAPPDAADHGTN